MKLTLYIISAVVIAFLLGQLVLARNAQPATEPAPAWTYTIQPNDTLWVIAKRFYPQKDPREAIWEIRQQNPSVNPGRLQIGYALQMPGGNPHDSIGKSDTQ